MANLYKEQGKYEQAGPFYQRALTIRQQCLRPTHPDTQEIQEVYTVLLRLSGRCTEAMAIEIGHKPSVEEGH